MKRWPPGFLKVKATSCITSGGYSSTKSLYPESVPMTKDHGFGVGGRIFFFKTPEYASIWFVRMPNQALLPCP